MTPITVHTLAVSDWQALLDFELRSRSWFEQSVAPRGDAFYCESGVKQHIAELLDGLAQGRWFPALLLNSAGTLVGRSNLKDIDTAAGVAELGYRVGQDQVGAGVATAAVRQMQVIARQQWGLSALKAVVSPANLASARVLEKCGFVRLKELPAEADQQHTGSEHINYRYRLV